MNTTGYELPRTGGVGSERYSAFGALLTLTAACTVLVLRAGEKRERKNSRKTVTKS